MMYWMAVTEDEYERLRVGVAGTGGEVQLANRTVVRVMPGEQGRKLPESRLQRYRFFER